MQISKFMKMIALGSGLVAANIAPFIATASAGERRGWQHRGHGFHAPYRQRHVAPHYAYGHGQHYRSRRHDGAGIALGIGALIIGGIIAAEASRGHHRH